MTESPLENQIKKESAQAIDAVRKKEELEIKKLEEAYSTDINASRKQTEVETDARIKQELSRLSNKAILDLRKFKLQSTENFINSKVNEVAKEIRDNPQYKQFLLEAIRDATGKTSADVEIHIKPEDRIWEKEILAAVETKNKNRNIIIKSDPEIHWGGCLVIDKEGGRIFNHTLERIYFRKSTLIRQKIMKILSEHFHEEKKSVIRMMKSRV